MAAFDLVNFGQHPESAVGGSDAEYGFCVFIHQLANAAAYVVELEKGYLYTPPVEAIAFAATKF